MCPPTGGMTAMTNITPAAGVRVAWLTGRPAGGVAPVTRADRTGGAWSRSRAAVDRA